MPSPEIILKVENLTRTFNRVQPFGQKRCPRPALNKINLNVYKNECLAVVGESGSGKTTLGKCLIRLQKAESGRVLHQGVDLLQMNEKAFRRFRRRFQMIHQNYTQALNPRQTVGACLRESLKVHGCVSKTALRLRTQELLQLVGLNTEHLSRFPHELSGGQRQRVAIARALTTSPKFLIADEPTSSLDALIQRQIVQLLHDLRKRLGLTVLLISHDLTLVAEIADRIAVMYGGAIIELASAEKILRSPMHPYTKLLIQCMGYQVDDADVLHLEQETGIQERESDQAACVYAHCCPRAFEYCFQRPPALQRVSEEHWVACHVAVLPRSPLVADQTTVANIEHQVKH